MRSPVSSSMLPRWTRSTPPLEFQVPCSVLRRKAQAGDCHLAPARFRFQERPLSGPENRRPAALPFDPGLEPLTAGTRLQGEDGGARIKHAIVHFFATKPAVLAIIAKYGR